MRLFSKPWVGLFVLGVVVMPAGHAVSGQAATARAAEEVVVPEFQVDPFWPKPLPNNWAVGHVTGVAVDSKDNVYLLHRARFQAGAENTPELLVFDPSGNLIRSWGASVRKSATEYLPGKDDWGTNVHGVCVDSLDNVWVTFGGLLGWQQPQARAPEDYANSADNAHVLKFTSDGKLLLEIGKFGRGTEGSNSTMHLGQPTDVAVDPKTDEVYITDGYTNRRVIVFDAKTGAYRRHWGAYGSRPVDSGPYGPPTGSGQGVSTSQAGDPKQQFSTPHCVLFSNDRLLYVCDRGNRRIQVFKADETFVKEHIFSNGAPWDLDLSRDPGQSLMYVVDGGTHAIHVLRRDSFESVATFGRRGRWAGQWESPDNVALDSKGNLFVAETLDGRRLQRFVPTRGRAATGSLLRQR